MTLRLKVSFIISVVIHLFVILLLNGIIETKKNSKIGLGYTELDYIDVEVRAKR